jgi:hypothetical protein
MSMLSEIVSKQMSVPIRFSVISMFIEIGKGRPVRESKRAPGTFVPGVCSRRSLSIIPHGKMRPMICPPDAPGTLRSG